MATATVTRVDRPQDLRGIVESLRGRLSTAQRAGAVLEAEGVMASQLVQRWKNNTKASQQVPSDEVNGEELASVLMRQLHSFRLQAALATAHVNKPETENQGSKHSAEPRTRAPPLQGSVSKAFALQRADEPRAENEEKEVDPSDEAAAVDREKAAAVERLEELRRERAAAESKHAEWLAASRRDVDEARAKAEDEVKKIRKAADAAKEELAASVARAGAHAALAIQNIHDRFDVGKSDPSSPSAANENNVRETDSTEETRVDKKEKEVVVDGMEEEEVVEEKVEEVVDEKEKEKEKVKVVKVMEAEESHSPKNTVREVRDSWSSFPRGSSDESSDQSEMQKGKDERQQRQGDEEHEEEYALVLQDLDVWEDSLIIFNPPQPDGRRSSEEEKEEEGEEEEPSTRLPIHHRRWRPSKRTRQAVGFLLRDRLFIHFIVMAFVSAARPGRRSKPSLYLQAASPRILEEVFSP